ncbi:MAG: hypothetical protein ACOX8H_12555 [Ruminococcus sp.]|jgi:DNA-binding LacI/PurR family transcriptional regulator
MKTRKMMMTILGMMMAGILAGCGITSMASTEETKGVIGYIGNEDDQEFARGIEEEAAAEGYACVISEGEGNRMMECIDILEKGADVIVLTSSEEEQETQKLIEAAHDNNVDVVLKTTEKSGTDYDKLVGQEGSEGGNTAAVCAIDLMEGK